MLSGSWRSSTEYPEPETLTKRSQFQGSRYLPAFFTSTILRNLPKIWRENSENYFLTF